MKLIVVAAALMVPAAAAAQGSAPVDPNDVRHTMIRAAGMPLNDGALPPGMLTVRVVKGAFAGDLPGETVVADIGGGRTERAQTQPDGRARFAHLPVGGSVRVSADVAGEHLESETFTMGAESGVRILLVAGADSAPAVGALPAAPGANDPRLAAPSAVHSSDVAQPLDGVDLVRRGLASVTLLAFAALIFQRQRRRPGRRSRPRVPTSVA